ncbi:hypothetical protein NEHOM01_1221 [Nematocida homosporus]|uniref:uncharacterized protein n=1 Tax=Nematocida homosporus TaxID=1912981 RepID=UPI0022206CB4|nr:uncharacterized protein NEHOM01_1221 [Nematocida homosporus]KAI5186018.1 hypothetical protein NEHOM01_1221 [Nematocida homosporus]
MRASDFFHPPLLRAATEDGEEREPTPTQSKQEWQSLAQKFLTPASHLETTIYREAELELARKELITQGIIREEKIERKTYTSTSTKTLKPALLNSMADRLQTILQEINRLEDQEDQKRTTINQLKGQEYIKRKNNTLIIHILDKLFLPISTITKGLNESFIVCTLFYNGLAHIGYITEKEVLAFDSTNTSALATAIQAFRDRANSTAILQEYFGQKERATIQRVSEKPTTQSQLSLFLICALKLGYSFSEAISLIQQRDQNFS